VMKGIDRAFESYARSRRGAAGKQLKSLTYCVDAVLDAAEEEKEAAAGTGPSIAVKQPATESFSRDEIRRYFERNAARLRSSAEELPAEHSELAARATDIAAKLLALLPLIDSPAALDLEDLERRLTILEEKLSATLSASAGEDLLLEIRRDLDRHLMPYRRRMSAAQLADLERRYTQKRLFEAHKMPRLSLFYMS